MRRLLDQATQASGTLRMADPRIKKQLVHLLEAASILADECRAEGVMVVSTNPLDWKAVHDYFRGNVKLLIACPKGALPEGSTPMDGDRFEAHGIRWVQLEEAELPVSEQIAAALLEAVAEEALRTGDTVVILYPAFTHDEIDSLSIVHLSDRLERFTAADLKQLEAAVPLETLRQVVELALEIAREGREGKPVGTMFIVGDTKNVKQFCKPMGYDPFKGVKKSERRLKNRRIREEIKELAQLDGAFIIDEDGYVVASRQWVAAPAEGLTLTKGLGSRHWAAAAISRATKAVVVVVSESTGTVRVFKDGEVKLRLEPGRRRTVKWQEFEYEPPLERLGRPSATTAATADGGRPEASS